MTKREDIHNYYTRQEAEVCPQHFLLSIHRNGYVLLSVFQDELDMGAMAEHIVMYTMLYLESQRDVRCAFQLSVNDEICECMGSKKREVTVLFYLF